jgi:hypothetical protein
MLPLLMLLVLDVGDLRQLFIDRRFIETSRNVVLQVHQPRKTGEISVSTDYPLLLGGTGQCVLFDNNTYHLWYAAGDAIGYARSTDGIRWEKPSDPIVIGRGRAGVEGRAVGTMVFIDPNAPVNQRFRMSARAPVISPMLQIFSSPDGTHWALTHPDVIAYDASKPHHLDSQNVVFWDTRLKRYVAYVRFNLRTLGSQGRAVARAESSDLGHFAPMEQLPVVMRAGDRDDIYTNGVISYPWADNAYLAFPTLYYHYGSWHREFAAEAPTNAGVLDGRFAVSRDGIEWNTFGWEPFVPLGMEGEFDSKRIYLAHGIVPARNGRELYMYYMGTNEVHGWNRDDRNIRLLTLANLAPRPERRFISRLVIRRDGFVSVRAPQSGCEFTTPVLRFRGSGLTLNIDTSAGEAQVEIQDAAGKPIPGYTLRDCDLIHTANETDRVVKWNGDSALRNLAGKEVRLRFLLRDADLYAFQFTPAATRSGTNRDPRP